MDNTQMPRLLRHARAPEKSFTVLYIYIAGFSGGFVVRVIGLVPAQPRRSLYSYYKV